MEFAPSAQRGRRVHVERRISATTEQLEGELGTAGNSVELTSRNYKPQALIDRFSLASASAEIRAPSPSSAASIITDGAVLLPGGF